MPAKAALADLRYPESWNMDEVLAAYVRVALRNVGDEAGVLGLMVCLEQGASSIRIGPGFSWGTYTLEPGKCIGFKTTRDVPPDMLADLSWSWRPGKPGTYAFALRYGHFESSVAVTGTSWYEGWVEDGMVRITMSVQGAVEAQPAPPEAAQPTAPAEAVQPGAVNLPLLVGVLVAGALVAYGVKKLMGRR